MADFATLDELKNRLDWTLDPDEERIAQAALEDASELARYYGKNWDADTAPRMVRTLVLRACKRYMDNPQGYNQSRAGDETVGWSDDTAERASTVDFTRAEQALLADLAGSRKGIYSVEVSAWGPQRKSPVGMVPAVGDTKSFPLFSDNVEPW